MNAPSRVVEGAPAGARIRAWWLPRRRRVLGGAIVVMSLLAVLKLASELHRLILSTGRYGAIDLLLLRDEVQRWFAGLPVYGELARLTQPPQTHVFLWPFLGWLDTGPARVFWAVTAALALTWLAVLAVRESGATTPRQRVFVALMLLSMNSVGVALGNGQLILHLLPAMVAAVLLLARSPRTWREDIAVAVLLNVALAKPTLSLPFVWLLLFAPRPARPLVLTAASYLLLSLFAASFQDGSLPVQIGEWLRHSYGQPTGGYGDLHSALQLLRLESLALPASLLLLAASGIWIYRYRHTDVWILLGVSALVARFWTYHRAYDDVLVFLPMLALYRIARRGPLPDDGDAYAGLLLACAIVAMLAPARLERWPPPVNVLYIGGHVIVWLAMLFFLAWRARVGHGEGTPSAAD